MTELYDPKTFIAHAASLRHPCGHCERFSTAASRRSLGSVSVPVWPIDLSVRLPVLALVGRYPANMLIGHRPLLQRQANPDTRSQTADVRHPKSDIRIGPYLSRHDHAATTAYAVLAPVSRGCPPLKGRLSMHYSPFRHSNKVPLLPGSPVRVRLACLIHAANVRSEPGSNPSIFCSISPPDRAGRNFKIESSHPCGICQRITPPAKTLGIAHNGFVQNRGTLLRMSDAGYRTSNKKMPTDTTPGTARCQAVAKSHPTESHIRVKTPHVTNGESKRQPSAARSTIPDACSIVKERSGVARKSKGTYLTLRQLPPQLHKGLYHAHRKCQQEKREKGKIKGQGQSA